MIKKSLFKKLLVSFLVVSLLVVIQGAVAYITFEKNHDLEHEVSEAKDLYSFFIEREVDHHMFMIKLYDMFTGGSVPAELKDHNNCALGKWYNGYQPTEEEKPHYDALNEPHVWLHESAERVVQLYKEGNIEEAQKVFRTETLVAVEGVRDNLHKLREVKQNSIQELDRQMEVLDGRIEYAFMISSIICLLIALALAYILTRSIVRPIKEITTSAEKIAEGDLTIRVPIEREDELGQLSDAFNSMTEKLKILVANIKEKSEIVVDAGTQLSAASDEAGHTSEEIANSIAQVAEGSESISRQVEELNNISDKLDESGVLTLETSEETLIVAKESEDAALRGKESVDKAIIQLGEVTEIVNITAEKIKRLGERSAQIGEMVELIQGIASQTNLLALNAAIEAARAGEHGKGFAVVAEEVRKLAEESSNAASRITSHIEDIKKDTVATIESTNESVEYVKEQVAVINEVGEALESIVEMAEKTRDKTNGMHEVARELKDQSRRMIDAVSSIAAVVEENAASSEEVAASAQETSASVEEVAASAEQLRTIAKELDILIQDFKV